MNKRLIEDFPINWEQDQFVSRREFFKFLTLASGGVATGTAALAIYGIMRKKEVAFDPVFVCNANDLQPGAALSFNFPRPTDLCLLVRKLDGEFVAYNRRCTHLSCPVEYEVKGKTERLYCPCHNGAFSVDNGSVLQGPPPRPIPRIKLDHRNGEIWATGAFSEENS